MLTKRLYLGMKLGIVPVRFVHRSFKIINDQGPRNAAKIPKGILERANEILGRLSKKRLTVSFARVTQCDPKDMTLFAFALSRNNGRTDAEVHLSLVIRSRLHASEWKRMRLAQPPNEATHTIVTTGKTMLSYQVLIDALSRQLLFQLALNDLTERFVLTAGTLRFILLT